MSTVLFTGQASPGVYPGGYAAVSLSDGRSVRLVRIDGVYRLMLTADGATYTQIGSDIGQVFDYSWSLCRDPSDNLYLVHSDGGSGAGGTSPLLRVDTYIKNANGWTQAATRDFSSGISGTGIAETRVGWVSSGRTGGHLLMQWYAANWQSAKIATINCDYLLGQTANQFGASEFQSLGGLQNTSANYFRIDISPDGYSSGTALVMRLGTSSGYLNPIIVSVSASGAITYGASQNLSSSDWPQGTNAYLHSRLLRISSSKWLIVAKRGSSSSEYVAGVYTIDQSLAPVAVAKDLNALFGFPVSYTNLWDAFADPQTSDVAWCTATADGAVGGKYQLRRVKLTVTGTSVTWASAAIDDENVTVPSGYSPNDFRATPQPIGRVQWGVDYYNGSGNGGSGAYHSVIGSTLLNNPPTAATPTTPTTGSTVDRTTPITLAWVFNDPDAGDSQSKSDIRYKLTSASTWTTILGATTTAPSYALPANQAAGNYEWQVLTYDALGVASPWSSSSFFTAADPPGVPVITAPANGGTIATAQYTVTWSSPQQDAYEVRRVADNAGSPNTGTVYLTTGTVEDATSRARTLTFDTNNRTEHVQVRVRYSGIWSQWANARVLVSYTPPATPVVVLTPQDATGSMLVAITNPTASGSQPTVASHDILIDDGFGEGFTRRVTGWAPGAAYTYWLPVSGRAYEGNIRVVAVATNGTTATGVAT